MVVDAVTQPGATCPTGYGETDAVFDRGWSMNGKLASSNAVWTGKVALPAATACKINATAITYTKDTGVDVYGPLAYTVDLAGQAPNHYVFGLQFYNATAGVAAGHSAYAVYVGRYSGTVGHWVGNPDGGVGVSRLYAGDGLALCGYGINAADWILYNPNADALTIEVTAAGLYNG